MNGQKQTRWDRLAETLGVDRVDQRSYPGGISRSITLRHQAGGTVEVHDKWWNKNDSIWVGWQVTLFDREGIVLRDFPITKKRGEVARNVSEAKS